jgi:hypothetical protein
MPRNCSGQNFKGKIMKFYVYSTEDKAHVATITGDSNKACEAAFNDGYDTDAYAATYSPAFGSADGLVENADADQVTA